MAAIGARQDNPDLPGTNLLRPCDGQRSGVLIIGSRQAAVFVATEALISADTLDDEEAIRVWLAQHDIHVVAPRSNTASTQKGAPEAIGS